MNHAANFVIDILTAVILLRIAYMDHETMEISDRLILALEVCGIVSCILNLDLIFRERIIGMLAVSMPMYLLCRIIPGAFGGGDIKLTAVMGFYLGWKRLLVGTYISCLIGGAQAVWLLVTKKVRRGEHAHMAFGPALCAGILIAMVWGTELLEWYFNIFY